MKCTIFNGDRLILSDEGIEVGSKPVGFSLDCLRWDGTALVNLTILSEIWVDPTDLSESGSGLHCIDIGSCQLVTMTWDDRNKLINDAGTIRVKTPTELQYEVDEQDFNTGVITSKNLIENQVDYTRKVPTDIIITDKDKTDPFVLKQLYNGLDSDYITVDVSQFTDDPYWIQYRFPGEIIVQKIFNFGIYDTTGSDVIGCFYGYSLNGDTWTYLGTDSTAHDNTENLIEYADQTSAIENYVTLSDDLIKDGSIIYRFLKGVSAKYFRIYFLPQSTGINQNDFQISEFRFDPLIHGTVIENASIGPEKLTFEIGNIAVQSISTSTVSVVSGYDVWGTTASYNFTPDYDATFLFFLDITYVIGIYSWTTAGYVLTQYRLLETASSSVLYTHPSIYSITRAYPDANWNTILNNNKMFMATCYGGVEYTVQMRTRKHFSSQFDITSNFRKLDIIGFIL